MNLCEKNVGVQNILHKNQYNSQTSLFFAGLGLGLIFAPAGTLINFYFDRRRALANGIVVSASGIGALAYPYLYGIFIDKYGLSGALMMISGILFNCCVAAALCRQPSNLAPKEKTKEQKKCCQFLKSVFSFRLSLFKNKYFCLITLSLGVTLLGYGSNYYMLPPHIVLLGYTKYDAALCLLIMGVAESVARVVMGWFTDLKILSPSMIFAGSVIIGGIASICLTFTSQFILVCAYVVVVGVFPATFYTLIPVILVDKIGLEALPASYGLVTMSMALIFVGGQPALSMYLFSNLMNILYFIYFSYISK